MVHSLIAQESERTMHGAGRKDEAQLRARELDEMGLTARAGSMRTVKGG